MCVCVHASFWSRPDLTNCGPWDWNKPNGLSWFIKSPWYGSSAALEIQAKASFWLRCWWFVSSVHRQNPRNLLHLSPLVGSPRLIFVFFSTPRWEPWTKAVFGVDPCRAAFCPTALQAFQSKDMTVTSLTGIAAAPLHMPPAQLQ